MITSTHNSNIQWVRKLQSRSRTRKKERLFVVEGVRLVEEALIANSKTRLLLYEDNLGKRGMKLVDSFIDKGVQVKQVTPQVMNSVSDTETPQGILAVLSMKLLPVPEKLDFMLILDGVRDPGNLGTMLRTASAAGVGLVYILAGSVDVYSPKVVRAAMGTHFQIPIRSGGWDQVRDYLKDKSMHVYLAEAGGGVSFNKVDLCESVAIIIGGEAEGAGETARGIADKIIHIPMPGTTESLNAAAAAAVLLFEVVRQRL